MQKTILKSLVVALLIGASSAKAAPIFRSADETPPQVHVSYADLDMNSEAGRKTLARRVRYATDAVCGGVVSRDLHYRTAQMVCRRNAMKGAEVQLARIFDGNRVAVVAANTNIASR